MPSEIMDQRDVSASSGFYEDMNCASEKQTGLQKPNGIRDHPGAGGLIPTSSSKLVGPTSLANSSPAVAADCSGQLQIEKPGSDREGFPNLSKKSSISVDSLTNTWSSFSLQPTSPGLDKKRDTGGIRCESSLFSCSLSDLFSSKPRLLRGTVLSPQPDATIASNHEELEPFESLEELEAQTIGNLLPDEDDLFSGVTGEMGRNSLANGGGDDMEDLDLFSSGGGMELEGDGQRNGQRGSNGLYSGAHVHGEFPSRTLFVRNINCNVEDSELKALFEQYGDIHTLYTACKHRGFVMISYYDIRAAQNAMRSLQGKLLRRRKLDIHYSIPKDNPSEEDINRFVLVVSNLDSSVSNNEVHQIFGAYGEIKEIRDMPHKNHQKLLEFYDVRAAEVALCTLNGSEVAGRQIKIERVHLGDDFDSVSSANMGVSPGIIVSSSMEGGSMKILHNPFGSPMNSFTQPHLSSSIPIDLHSPARVMPIGKPIGIQEPNHSVNQCIPNLHPHSFPEYHDAFANGSPYKTSRALVEMVENGFKVNGGFETRGIGGAASNGYHPIGLVPGGNGNAMRGSPHIWNNNSQQQHSANTMIWPHSPSGISGVHAHRFQPVTAFSRAPPMIMKAASPVPHHMGSAPTTNSPFWDGRHTFVTESPESSSFHMGSPSRLMDMSPHNIFAHVGGNNHMDISAISVGPRSPHIFSGRSPMVSMPSSFDSHSERFRNYSHRRNESSSSSADKKQYELDIDRILLGEDNRTTLMIKNIPNKYTSKMLLAAIDEHCKGTYDFIYLPIDFKNKCNVGYAFINMTDPRKIIPFHQAFNGKKWEKFNSEKVASLAYARIQGKAALIAHFQNSSLMNEDKRCRPILFHTEGPNAGDQEPFPMNSNIRSKPGKPRTFNNDETYGQGSSSSTNGTDSA